MGEPKKLSLSVEPMQPGEWRWEFRNYTTRELFTSGMSGTEREAFEDAVVSVTTAFSLAMAEWRDRANAAVARAEAAEAEAEHLRGLLSAERDGYAAGVADGRKAGAGDERDLIVAYLRDLERGAPGVLTGAADHIAEGCHWPEPLGSIS